MKPVEFNGEGKAITFAKDQPQYDPLPARVTEDGTVITMWEPDPVERSAIAAGAFVQLNQATYHQKLQPIAVNVAPPIDVVRLAGSLTPDQMALALGQLAAEIVEHPGNLKHWHLTRSETGEIKGLYVEL